MTLLSYNTVKTVFLLSLLSSILLGFGYLINGYTGLQIALILALITNGISYFYSDTIVLRMYRAKPLDRGQYSWLYTMVEELSRTMHLPMPKLWLIDNESANAFATGRNPAHGSIAVTKRILEILSPQELRGVLAHELAHIKNRDILIGTIAAVIATAITYVAYMVRWTGAGTYSSDGSRKSGNIVFLFFASILVPIGATLLQLAISRSREYGADETGATSCKDPLALAQALRKLEQDTAHSKNTRADESHAATDSLFIVRPVRGDFLRNIFATHPPISERIKRLEKLSIRI